MPDPNTTLTELRDLVKQYGESDDEYRQLLEAERIADLFWALDDYLTEGGELPAAWRKRA
jgi:hypothetical protein